MQKDRQDKVNQNKFIIQLYTAFVYSQLLAGTTRQNWESTARRLTLAKALEANLEWILRDKTRYVCNHLTT